MSEKLNGKIRQQATAPGRIARTVAAFRTRRAINLVKKTPHEPYGDHADALGAEAYVSHLDMKELDHDR